MGAPSPSIYPLGQGIMHGGIVASPTDPTVVYISGDADSQSPFDGITFRGVFSAGGTTWTRVVGSGANNTAPHSDSRAMVIDPLGNLLQGNDGGIFRLVTPSVAATRTWNAVVGNLVTAESHSGAYDPVSKVYISGNQDNGTAFQPTPGSLSWFQLWEVTVETLPSTATRPLTLGPRSAIRAFSFWAFQPLELGCQREFPWFLLPRVDRRRPGRPDLFQVDPNLQFYNPYVLNNIDPSRMLIGTAISTNRWTRAIR